MARRSIGVGDSVSIEELEDATLVIESEGISSNDNDTTIPTSAAVKDYVDNNGGDVSGPGSSTDNAAARFDGTGGKTLQNSVVLIDDTGNVTGVNQLDVDSANGVDVNPGSDIDADLITVGVTGAPKIQWDESQDSFKFTKGIEIDDNVAITFGTGFDSTLQWDGTDLILDYDSQGGGTTDFRIQENGTDHFVVETGGEIGMGETTPLAQLHVTKDQAALTELRLDNSNASGSMAYTLYDGSNERGKLHYDTASALLTLGTNIAGGQVRINTAADVEALRIDANGQVSLVAGDLDANGNTILNLDASATAKGIVELATAAETTTGTDTGRAVTPDGLAGSDYGKRVVQAQVIAGDADVATGDGQGNYRFFVPAELNGYNLVDAHAAVVTAGTTGTTDVQIHNVTDAADMLSTKITIDSGEKTSYTAATAPVVDGTADDVATGDEIRIDCDAVSSTAPKGLIVILTFQLP